MGCYNCTYLDSKVKKEGKINGCIYYCTKTKQFVNGACDNCPLYTKDLVRETYENNEIYHNGRHYSNGNNMPLSIQVFIVAVLLIMAIILNNV